MFFGPKSLNSDSKTSQFAGTERLKNNYASKCLLMTNVFLGPSASRDDTISRFGL